MCNKKTYSISESSTSVLSRVKYDNDVLSICNRNRFYTDDSHLRENFK